MNTSTSSCLHASRQRGDVGRGPDGVGVYVDQVPVRDAPLEIQAPDAVVEERPQGQPVRSGREHKNETTYTAVWRTNKR